MAARKKATLKKAPAKKPAEGAEIAWRNKYLESEEKVKELEASVEALLASHFGVDWNEKAEELSPRVADYLRLILTTTRGQGRTRFILNAVHELATRENGPDFVAVIAAHHEHRQFLQDRFHEIADSKTQGGHREAIGGCRVIFATLAEEHGGKLRGVPGLLRFVDHFTIEHELMRIGREKP